MDSIKGLQSYGGFNLRGRVPQIGPIQRTLAAKLCVGPPKVLGVQERARFLYHHAKFGGVR